MISSNPWDTQRTPCCGSHVLGLPCCDPNDCGPCCENCPTCPTIARARGIVDGIEMGKTAAEYHRRENPMNGDGSNVTVDAILGSLNLMTEKTSSERDKLLERYQEHIDNRILRQTGRPLDTRDSIKERIARKTKEFEKGAVRMETFVDPWMTKFTYADGSIKILDGMADLLHSYPPGTAFPS